MSRRLDEILAAANSPKTRGEIELAAWRDGEEAREVRAAFELPAIKAAIARGLADDAARFKRGGWASAPIDQGDPDLPREWGLDGRLRPVAECDDTFAKADEYFQRSKDWQNGAEAAAMRHMEDETGQVVSEAKHEKRLTAEENQSAQASDICRALGRVGVNMYRTDNVAAYRYYLHSDFFKELPNYRRVMLNPVMAANARAPKLAAIEHFMSLHDPWRFRFFTFTSGKRCKSPELRERCQWMFRRLSKLNARIKKMGFPCEFIFRSCEFGKTEKTNKNGANTGGEIQRFGRHVFYHPHIHCILFVYGDFMSEAKWGLFISVIHDFWRRNGEKIHWDADGMIKNARECVKYVTKPGDMVTLARTNPHELKRLYEATAGVRMVAPMGELKNPIRARKDAGIILVKKTTNDGCIWLEIRDPDKGISHDEHTDSQKRLISDAREIARIARKSAKPVCEVVKRCMPTVGPLRVKEPTVLVVGNTLDKDRVRRHPLVARLRHYTRESFLAGLRLAQTDYEALARVRLDQGSHGHINCPDGIRDDTGKRLPLEIEHGFIPERDFETAGCN